MDLKADLAADDAELMNTWRRFNGGLYTPGRSASTYLVISRTLGNIERELISRGLRQDRGVWHRS